MAVQEQINEIVVEELRYEDGTTVVGQESTPGLTAREMQLSVESLGRNVIIPALNRVIRILNGSYTKDETDAAIQEKMVEIGAGDMAKGQYDPSGAVLAAGGMPGYTAAVSSEKAAAYRKPLEAVTVVLPASGWSESAPYTQTVSVAGMTADWVPGVPVLSLSSSVKVTTLLAATEALGCIKMITSAAGKLTFTAPEDKPGAALTLRVPGMVERS